MTLLLDIDGVVCENRQPISDEMKEALSRFDVYFVTGNSYTDAVDLVGGGKIFCNMADELREDGRLLWKDEVTPRLPPIDWFLLPYGEEDFLPGNCFIEWRGPRFVNFSEIGRFATTEKRASHDFSWRRPMVEQVKDYNGILWNDVDASIGGQVSIDIYSKGADKSRAGKWLNDQGLTFTFIGDKTDPGGNDYPLVQYCEKHPQNKWFKSTGPAHTLEILKSL